MAGRASIVGAAVTHVGKVREHNEDSHFLDVDGGVFVVCDGMGGHAAGEVASALAIRTIRGTWSSDETARIVDSWLEKGTPDARKQLLGIVRAGVVAAHDAIVAEAARDDAKSGMGTTFVGAMIVGNELVFAHAGDSRAYLVRDGIAMQLTEDHTLLARLLAAGIEVDVSGEGSRFRSMLTNALGIGAECRVSTFVVPLADGDRFLLCSDGISEYVPEAEVGTVLTNQPSPARAAQKLVELALDRGGGDNATAVVVRVLEAGERPQPAELRKQDDAAIEACPLWGGRVTPQQRLRALRIAIARDFHPNERLPAHTLGDRVAWIIVEGELERNGVTLEPGAFVYPESLLDGTPAPDRDSLAVTTTDVRALALRADDFREICDEDAELGEALLEALAPLVSRRSRRATHGEAARRITEPVDAPAPPPENAGDAPVVEVPLPRTGTQTVIVDPPLPPLAGTERVEMARAPTPLATPKLVLPTPVRAPTADPAPLPPAPRSPRSKSPAEGSALLPATTRPTTPPPLGTRKLTPVKGSPELRITPPAGAPAVAPPRSLTPPVGAPSTAPPRPLTPPRGSTKLTPSAVVIPPPIRRVTEPSIVEAVETLEVDPKLIEPRIPRRAITEPEIETYFEIEADAPPEPVEAESDHEEVVVSIEDGNARVTETVFDDSEQTMTLSVTEPVPDAPVRPRTITPDDSPTATGEVDVPEAPTQPGRAKRLSEGWDD